MKILLALFCLVFSHNAYSQTPANKFYTISGIAKGMDDRFIYALYQNKTGGKVVDSTLVKKGEFVLAGNISEPTVARIAQSSSPDWRADGGDFSQLLFLEPRKMAAVVESNDFKNLKLSGSVMQSEFYALEEKKKPIYAKLKPYNARYDSLNTEYIRLMKAKAPESDLESLSGKMNIIREEMAPFGKEIQQIDKDFFEQHPNSYFTAYQLRYYVSGASYSELNSYYTKMSPEVQSSQFGTYIKTKVDEALRGSVGTTATLFSSVDVNGEALNLADYKGQYVLLDFWASWCRPCRAGNPHLIELYNKYKKKGIEFIGVSDDDGTEDKWKGAIAKDNIGVWKHVLRGVKVINGAPDFTNDKNRGYGIHSLPTKILIDPNGSIIGRYGDGGESHEELDKKLKSIFKS